MLIDICDPVTSRHVGQHLDARALERLTVALERFRAGGMVIVTDDDDRENEGDLIIAAERCRTEDMAFLIRHTSGIICVPMLAATARRFDLPPMVRQNDAPFATAFTVAVDYRHGTTTGISAADRGLTARSLAGSTAVATDFARPGHVFPLVAREGGVLERDGHTEAAVDLCRLTGQTPVAVIGELMNDDGTVMRGEALAGFAAGHDLPQLSIRELIALRLWRAGEGAERPAD